MKRWGWPLHQGLQVVNNRVVALGMEELVRKVKCTQAGSGLLG